MASITINLDVSQFDDFWDVARQALAALYFVGGRVEFEFDGKVIRVSGDDTPETLWEKYKGEQHVA